MPTLEAVATKLNQRNSKSDHEQALCAGFDDLYEKMLALEI